LGRFDVVVAASPQNIFIFITRWTLFEYGGAVLALPLKQKEYREF